MNVNMGLMIAIMCSDCLYTAWAKNYIPQSVIRLLTIDKNNYDSFNNSLKSI